jgi:hypothetical protein
MAPHASGGISIDRITDNQIAEVWVEPNAVSLLERLGRIPPV